MVSVSVSNLDYFRSWLDDEEADLDVLLRRLRGEEPQSEVMKAGEALHTALENGQIMETAELSADGYRFYVQCEATIELPEIYEHKIEKLYGGLNVRGRVDGLTRLGSISRITDYKTTKFFDPDNYLEGYQWRFYLDMTGCDWFFWKIFVLKEFGDQLDGTHTYEITQFHELSQHRYEGMEADCQRLAAQYLQFVRLIGEEKVRRTCYA
jgi:hypothetical protein